MNSAFNENCSTEELFNTVMSSDIRNSLFEGYNCTCFVYGMTGAGKTYTMFGDICNYLTMNSPVKGLIMLSLKEITSFIKEKNDKLKDDSSVTQFSLKLSYLEIYNEQIYDLLA